MAEPLAKRVEALFFAASRHDAGELAAFLDAREADDPEAVAEVRAMLDVPEDELLRVFTRAGIEPATPHAGETAGDFVGPYKLLEELGEGGFGTVWRAEQSRPVRRTVALKILKAGMDTKQVLARFEAERNALSLMNHPNIARVFDAGATANGRPFFVMELVEGIPVTEFCDLEELSIESRLEVFLDVCAAVQHAHQKGVIHRDLKPANILVTMQDGAPVPKVIDFGIAKATGQSLSEATLFTAQGQLMGTPEYMSPEQAEMSGIGVDSTTDVYALGVLLYELLTGVLPFDPATLRSRGLAEIHRFLREEEPPKPSTRISTLGADTAAIGKRRGLDPRKLRTELSGDLDWIVLRAMEKQRTRRYPSASELAADVRRHLDDEPVTAGPPSAAYRTKKFVKRHRRSVVLAGAAVLLLVAGIVATTREMLIANRALAAAEVAREDALASERTADAERAEARAVTDFLLDTLGLANPDETLQPEMQMADALAAASAEVGERFAAHPEVEAELRLAIGRAYDALGRPDLAFPHLRRSLALHREVLGSGALVQIPVLDSLIAVGDRLENQAWVAWAHEHFALTLELLAETSPDLAGRLFTLMNRANTPAVPPETVRLEWNALRDELFGRLAHDELGGELAFRALYAVAEQLAWRSLTLEGPEMIEELIALLPEENPDHRDHRFLSERALFFRLEAGDFAGAKALARERIAALTEVLGEDHDYLADYRSVLAVCLGREGRYDEARALLEECLVTFESLAVPDTSSAALARTRLARLHQDAGHPDRAKPYWQASVDRYARWDGPVQWSFVRSSLPPVYAETVAAYDALAEVFVECTRTGEPLASRAAEVRDLVQRFLDLRRRDCPDADRAALLIATHLLGDGQRLLRTPGLEAAGESLVVESVRIGRAHPDAMPMFRLQQLAVLRSLRLAQDRGAEARALAREVDAHVAEHFAVPGPHDDDSFVGNDAIWYAVREEGYAPATYAALARWAVAALLWVPGRRTHVNTCGVALYRAGRLEQAIEQLEASDRIAQQLSGDPDAPGEPADLAFLAMAHHRLGHAEEAAAAMKRLRAAMETDWIAADAENAAFSAEAEALLDTESHSVSR